MLIKSLPNCLVLLSCSTMSSTSYVPKSPRHINLYAPTHTPIAFTTCVIIIMSVFVYILKLPNSLQNLFSKILGFTSRINRLVLPSIACLLTLLPHAHFNGHWRTSASCNSSMSFSTANFGTRASSTGYLGNNHDIK